MSNEPALDFEKFIRELEDKKKELKLDKEKEFGLWFRAVLRLADIVDDRYPAKGMYYLPWYGLELTKNVIHIIETLLKESDHKEERFPTLIPYSIFMKEKDFFEGFQGEGYIIERTIRGKELEEKLVLRPTSETVMYYFMSQRIKSYKDLPIKIFQTVNIFRCETKMTKPFLRLREVMFFNEAHTFHSTKEEAEKQIKEAIAIYKKFFDSLGIPYLIIKVPEWDTFPGALYNYDFITVLPDGKGLELGSVINLGQKFAKAFDIRYLDKSPFEKIDDKIIARTKYGKTIIFEINDGKIKVKTDNNIEVFDLQENKPLEDQLFEILEKLNIDKNELEYWKYVWQTCYGVAERTVGALIAIHGDNLGLILLPKIAPIQVVIIPIYREENKEKVLEYAKEVYKKLKDVFRVYLDDRDDKTPGWKFYYWDIKGVPIRIDIGMREVEENTVTIVRRDNKNKIKVQLVELEDKIKGLFEKMERDIKDRSKKWFYDKIKVVESLEDLEKCIKETLVVAPLCNSKDHAEEIEKRYEREVLGFVVEGIEVKRSRCILCGKETEFWAVIGKTY